MNPRDAILTRFITACGWDGATRTTVAGDASNRRYLRLTQGDETAIVMDAPPDKGEDVRPFVEVAEYLLSLGLSAPRILARDVTDGLLLIEDLGDDLFARVVTQRPETENSLYSTAIDVLLALHRHPPPRFLAPYSVPVMAEMAALAAVWYAAGIRGENDALRHRHDPPVDSLLDGRVLHEGAPGRLGDVRQPGLELGLGTLAGLDHPQLWHACL